MSYIYAIGRRKNAIATVRLYQGSGASTVNNKSLDSYLTTETHGKLLELPFKATNTFGKFYFTAKTVGGGVSGQVSAIQLGISRAMSKLDVAYRSELKKLGLLTRDDRIVERKKTGLRKARKRPQFSKR